MAIFLDLLAAGFIFGLAYAVDLVGQLLRGRSKKG